MAGFLSFHTVKHPRHLFVRFTFCVLYALCCVCHVQSQHFKPHILFLASDTLHGRAPATDDEKKAAAYIAQKLSAANCTITFQKFPFEKDSALNVFGFLDFKKDSTVIISAHYDHLGYGNGKSKEILKKGIHHGADDNASGVAMLLELAKNLSKNKKLKYNFLFAAYSGHEEGLYGSGYFAQSHFFNLLKVRAVINMDMVGRLDATSKTLRVGGATTDSLFLSFYRKQQNKHLHFRFDDENIQLGDLKPFAEKGIPVLHITTGIHDDYHRISDTEDKINYKGMELIFELLHNYLQEVH